MMNVRKLQQQAAAAADELLSISRDMDQCIIPIYKTAPKEIFDMQCRVMIGRCVKLCGKLRQLQADLADAQQLPEAPTDGRQLPEAPADASADVFADARLEEQRKSIAVTQRLIGQNLLLLEQKQELLEGFLAHSDEIHVHLKNSEQIENMAEVTQLENILRRELHLCRTEDRK